MSAQQSLDLQPSGECVCTDARALCPATCLVAWAARHASARITPAELEAASQHSDTLTP